MKRSAPVVLLVLAGCPSPKAGPNKPDVGAVPIPQAPEGADPELVAIASSMCAATWLVDHEKKLRIGCRRPPPFKGAGRAPNGTIPEFKDDLMTFCGISVGARGSFTAPGKKEALVTIQNCRDDEDDTGWNGSAPGSYALVEQLDGRFRPVVVEKGADTNLCTVIRRADGRDTLICRGAYEAMSIGTYSYFFSLDFAGGKAHARTVAQIYDDVDHWTCMAHDGQPEMAPNGITGVARIDAAPAKDVNADGTPDFAIDVDRAHAPPSPALEKKLKALCAGGGGRPSTALPPPTRTRIDLVSDGTKFRPSPASRALLDKWRAESPDVTQFDPVSPTKLED